MMQEMWTISRGRLIAVEVYDDDEKSINGQYFNALQRALSNGDESELDPYADETVGGYVLETRLDVIEDMAAHGELDFRDLYVS